MITENVSTLTIHKMSHEQYEREYKAGNIDPNAIYLTPDPTDEVNLAEVIEQHNTSETAHDDIREAIPSKVSDLDNDAGYITADEVPEQGSGVYVGSGDMPEGYNVQIDVSGDVYKLPTKVSQLENDAGFITAEEVPDFDTTELEGMINTHVENKNNPHSVTAAQVGAPTVEQMNQAIAAIPTPDVSGQIGEHNIDTGAHADIRQAINAIKVPTKTSELTNDSGFITAANMPDIDTTEIDARISQLESKVDSLTLTAVTVYSGVADPTNDIGEDGDLYLVVE